MIDKRQEEYVRLREAGRRLKTGRGMTTLKKSAERETQ